TILMAAHGSEKLARDALKEYGAFDYVAKPVDVAALSEAVAAAARHARTQRELDAFRRQGKDIEPLGGIIATRGSMTKLLARVRRLANSKLTVLVYGESGTGKELVARAVHSLSDRRTKPWLAANCAGFSEGVLESELFGHVKGAFTGAIADRR